MKLIKCPIKKSSDFSADGLMSTQKKNNYSKEGSEEFIKCLPEKQCSLPIDHNTSI